MWVTILGLGWYTVLVIIAILAFISARRRSRPPSPLPSLPSPIPPISILRPLKGLDSNLYENLESTFKQIYPPSSFEIIFSVKDADDPAIPVVRDLQAKYPGTDASLIIGDEVVGVNPKINNLIRPFRAAKYDILWVLDSNILTSPSTLSTSLSIFTSSPKIGLVHHLPFSILPANSSPGSQIEHIFLNTTHAKMYLALNMMAMDSCVVGKSNIYRKSDVDRLTLHPTSSPSDERGLQAFAQCLAEDNIIASGIWHQLSLSHSLPSSPDCVVHYYLPQEMSISSYISRRVRWIRVRKHMVIAATILEPFTESILSGIVFALALHCFLPSAPRLVVFTTHTIAWLLLDLIIYHTLSSSTSLAFLPWLKAWLLRELLAFPIWLIAVCGSRVEWRGEVYKMNWRGEAVRVDPVSPSRWWFSTTGAKRAGYEAVASED